MELEMNEIPAEVQEILEHYGATLDDGGEPEETPEHEGEVTMPTPDEMEREREEWAAKVQAWNRGGDAE